MRRVRNGLLRWGAVAAGLAGAVQLLSGGASDRHRGHAGLASESLAAPPAIRLDIPEIRLDSIQDSTVSGPDTSHRFFLGGTPPENCRVTVLVQGMSLGIYSPTAVAIEGRALGSFHGEETGCTTVSHVFPLEAGLVSTVSADGTIEVAVRGAMSLDHACPLTRHVVSLHCTQPVIGIDFGGTPRGGTTEIPLTISNQGGGTLEVSAIELTGGDYSVSQNTAVVEAGARVSVVLAFTPSVVGARPGGLRLLSNDPTHPIVELPLEGVGVDPPDPHLAPSGLDVVVPSGEKATHVLTLSNHGTQPLEFAAEILGEATSPACAPDSLLVLDGATGALSTVSLDGAVGSTRTAGLEEPRALVLGGPHRWSYVSEPDRGRVSAVEMSLGVKIPIATGLDGPTALALSHRQDVLYVLQQGSGALSVIDLETNLPDTIATGLGAASGLTVDPEGHTAFVSNILGGSLQRIDLLDGEVMLIAEGLGAPVALATNPHSGDALVADLQGGQLLSVDVATGDRVALLSGLVSPVGLAVDPVREMAYVLESSPGGILVVDLALGSIERTIPVGGRPAAVVALLPEGCDGSFLTLTPSSGTVPASGSGQISVGFDASNLIEGTYGAQIVLHTNDPEEQEATVPVALSVTAGSLIKLSRVAERESTLPYSTAGAVTNHNLSVDGLVATEGLLEVVLNGEYGTPFQSSSLFMDGVFLGSIGNPGEHCAPTAWELTLPAQAMSSFGADGIIAVQLRNTSSVGVICALNEHSVRLRYGTGPGELDFGGVRLGEQKTLSVLVTNTQVPLLEVSVSTDVTGILVEPQVLSVAFQDSEQVDVTFSPVQVGPISGTLVFSNTDPIPTQETLPIFGEGITPPSMQVLPSELDVSLTAGETAVHAITVANIGGSPLEFLVHLGAASEFLTVDPAVGSVPVDGQITLEARFQTRGVTPGTRTSPILITSNDPALPEFSVGVTFTLVGGANIRVKGDPQTLESAAVFQGFGAVTSHMLSLPIPPVTSGQLEVFAEGAFGPGRTATVAAEGTILGPVGDGSFTCGTAVAKFVIDDPLLSELGADGVVGVEVANNDISAACPSNSHRVRLTYRGPSEALAFGDLFVGDSAFQNLEIENIGDEPLHAVMSIDGSPAFAPSVNELTLAPAETRVLSVTFAPLDAGPAEAELLITSNDADTPQIFISLQGAGLDPPIIEVQPGSIVEALPAGQNRDHAIVVSNAGGNTLHWEVDADYTGPVVTVDASPVFEEGGDPRAASTYVAAAPTQAESVSAIAFEPPSLEDVVEAFDQSVGALLAAIPNRFAFSGGQSGTSISDGFRNMYDDGNILSVDGLPPLQYTGGQVNRPAAPPGPVCVGGILDGFPCDSSNPGDPCPAFNGTCLDLEPADVSYVTVKAQGLFFLAADLGEFDSFTVSGGLGANGAGRVDGLVLDTHRLGVSYRAFVKRVFNAATPSVNHLIIVPNNPASSHEFSTNTDDDYHRVFGLAPGSRLYYLLYSGWEETYIDDGATVGILESLLALLPDVPGWIDVTPDRGSVAPGTGQELVATIDAGGVPLGLSEATLLFRSNDIVNPGLELPVSLVVLAEPDVVLSRGELSLTSVADFEGPGAATSHVFAVSEDPGGAGSLQVGVEGSFGFGKTASVSAEGVELGIVTGAGPFCAQGAELFPLTAEALAGMTTDGQVEVVVQNDASVLSSCTVDRHTVELRYPIDALRMRFEPLFIGLESALPLTVENRGTATLEIEAITTDAPEFIASLSSVSIPPGAAQELEVSFRPQVLGPRSAELTLLTNDPDEPVVVVALSGVGLDPPVLVLDPESVLEELVIPASSTRVLTVQNPGGSDLVWNLDVELLASSLVIDASPVFEGSAGLPATYSFEPESATETLSLFGIRSPELGTVQDALNENFADITSLIPDRYDFLEGEEGFAIVDGGRDLYDVGNILGTDLGAEIAYSNDRIRFDPAFGPTGRYFTRKFPGLFVMAADLSGVESFTISGDLGSGFGDVDGVVLEIERAGVRYRGFVKRVQNFRSINHLVIVVQNDGAGHEFSTSSEEDYHAVHGLLGSDRIYYLLFSQEDGLSNVIDDEMMLEIMKSFLGAIPEIEPWIRAEPRDGVVAPGGTQELAVSFETSHLVGRELNALLHFLTNDPLRPSATVPVQLVATGHPDLRVQGDVVELESSANYDVAGARTVHSIPTEVTPSGDGVMEVTAWGDFGLTHEIATIFLEGEEVDFLGRTGVDCGASRREIPVSESDLTAGIADGSLDIEIQNSGSVGTFCLINRHAVTVRYPGPAERIDFGSVFADAEDTVHLRLRNVGTDVLEIASVASDTPEFTVAPGPTSLPPGADALLSVSFTSALPGTFEGTLTIVSNDPDEPSTTVPLLAEVELPPVINVHPLFLEATVPFGGEAARAVTVRNTGGSDLVYSVESRGRASGTGECSISGVVITEPERGRLLLGDFARGTARPLAVDLGRPLDLAVDPVQDTALVVDASGGRLLSVDLGIGTARVVTGELAGPVSVDLGPAAERAYVLEGGAGYLTEVSLIDGARTVIAAGLGPEGFVRLAPSGETAFVTQTIERTVLSVDLSTGSVQTLASALIFPIGIDVTDDGSFLYVVESPQDRLNIIDLETGVLTRAFATLGHSTSIELDIGHGRAYVAGTSQGDGAIRTVELETGLVATRLGGLDFPPWGMRLLCGGTIPDADPAQGAISPGSTAELDVLLRSTGLPAGTHAAELVVTSNDPVAPAVPVAIQLTVVGAPDVIVGGDRAELESIVDLGSGSVSMHSFPIEGPLGGAGSLELVAEGAFFGTTDQATLSVEGMTLGQVMGGQGFSCARLTGDFPVDSLALASFAVDGIVEVRVANSPLNPICEVNRHVVRLRYLQPLQQLQFAPVFVGLTSEQSFTITNQGTDELVVELAADSGDFLFSDEILTLAPGEDLVVPIMFQPSTPRPIGGTLRLLTNDPDEPEVEIPLQGEGLDPPVIEVTPPAFHERLVSDEHLVRTLEVRNAGGASLAFDIRHEAAQAAPRVLYSDDMESGAPGWIPSPPAPSGDQWLLSTARAASGSTSWAVPSAPASGTASLQSPPIDLSGLFDARLTFRHFFDFDECGSAAFEGDGGIVEVSSDGGATWEQVHPVGGYPNVLDDTCANPLAGLPAYSHSSGAEFVDAVFDLTAFVGGTVLLRFQVGWDCGNCEAREGWYVDDVNVTTTSPDWFSAFPTNGVVEPGGFASIEVRIDASGKPPGTLTGTLDISSNDPAAPSTRIPMSLEVFVNSPPVASISGASVVECEDQRGSISLFGGGSTDPDSTPGTSDDIVAFEWFEDLGLPSQRLLSESVDLVTSLALGEHRIALRVTDQRGLSDVAELDVRVEDTLAPSLEAQPAPGILWPPNHGMVPVTVGLVSGDRCDPEPEVVLVDASSSEPDNDTGSGDGDTTDDVSGADRGSRDTELDLRAERSGAGMGRTYELSYRATDASGNTAPAVAMVTVPRDQGVGPEPLILRLEEVAPGGLLRIYWSSVPESLGYDVIAGSLSSLHVSDRVIHLGTVEVLGWELSDTAVLEPADRAPTVPGEGVYYLVQSRDAHGGVGFGTVTARYPRHPSTP